MVNPNVLLCLLAGACPLVSAAVNFTVISYGLSPPTILSSLPLAGPGFDMGLEKITRIYGYNISHKYLSPTKAVFCSDLADHLDLLSRYYYTGGYDRNNPAMLVLPGCDDLIPLGKFAREWNVLMLSSGLSYEELRNRTHYPTAVNNGPMQLAMFAEVFVKIFDYFSWTSIAVLLDTGAMAPFFKLWPNGLITLVGRPQNQHISLQLFRFNSSAGIEYDNLLKDVRKISRVVVLSSTPKIVRNFMVHASALNMTNGEYCETVHAEAFQHGKAETPTFVYFTVEPLRNNRYFGNLTWQYYDDDDHLLWSTWRGLVSGSVDEIARKRLTLTVKHRVEAMEAYRSLMQIAPCYNERLENNSEFLQELIRRSRANFNYTYLPGEPPNTFVFAAYQSALMLGKVLHEATRLGGNVHDGAYLASHFLDRTFHLDFEDAYIDSAGERRSNYCISALSARTKLFQPVLYYDARNRNITIMTSVIDWGNDEHLPPPNQPRCGYMENNLFCLKGGNGNIFVTAAVLAVVLLIGVLGTVLYFIRKTKRESAALVDTWWFVSEQDIIVAHPTGLSYSRNMSDRVTLHKITMKLHTKSLATALTWKFTPEPLAIYKGAPVWLTECQPTDDIVKFPSNHARVLLKQIKALDQTHIARLVGISYSQKRFALLSEFCERGSLVDVLHSLDLDLDFKYSFLYDLAMGLKEIHASPIRYHGRLSVRFCLVDARFSLKIGYLAYDRLIYGFAKWEDIPDYAPKGNKTKSKERPFNSYVLDGHDANWLQRQDLKSFGQVGMVVMDFPIETSKQTADRASVKPWLTMLDECLDEGHHSQMKIGDVMQFFRTAIGRRQLDFMTRVQDMMSKYAGKLENMVMERTTALLNEQKNCDKLLREVLPGLYVEQLRKGEHVKAELYDSATVFFGSLFGFQHHVLSHLPTEIAALLNNVYTTLDLVLPHFSVFKLETIAETYLVVSGVPHRNGNKHANEICRMALEFVESFRIVVTPKFGLELRGGINTGPCAAGIVGYKSPRFCLFGDTINTASRMESHGLPSKLHVSDSTVTVLGNVEDAFLLVERGLTLIKGKGECKTYWLDKH